MDVGGVGTSAMQSGVSIRMLRESQDQQKQQANQMLKVVNQAPQPAHLGQQIDFQA